MAHLKNYKIMFSIKNKVIVITGGNGLLGSKIVELIKSNDGIVYSLDIVHSKNNDNCLIVDINDENTISIAIEKIFKKHNKIDAWINNAYPRTSDWGNKIEDVSIQSWSENVHMHLNGYFLCSKLILEKMKTQKFGTLINMASIYGIVAPDFSIYEGTQMTMPVAYSAIKGGLISLTKYLASYYGKYNIRVNALSPGGIYDNQNDHFVKRYNERVPLRRMGKSDDISGVLYFLLTDESSYITGHNLVVDGGWSIL